MIISKLDAANRQLILAVHLFFGDGDPVCIHSLASNAREIYEKTCAAKGVERFFDNVLLAHPGNTQTELMKVLNEARTFFKHPGEALEQTLDFEYAHNEYALIAACHDCQSLCGADMPIEAGVFLCWLSATYEAWAVVEPEGPHDHYLRAFDNQFPGLREAPLEEKLRFGRELLARNLE